MQRHLLYIITVVALCLAACGNSRQRQVEDFRHQKRTEFYEEKLREAQQELAKTDSMLQIMEATGDSLNIRQRIRQDSLELQSEVLGAKIRYIHRKQKELQ